MPEQMDDALKAADRIIELTGGEIRLGLALGALPICLVWLPR